MGDYRSLKVWERAHALALEVYRLSATYPAAERYGLTSQSRRAAASIPANLAEGCGRNSDPELARFCRISLGSANELDYHLMLARDLGFLSVSNYDGLASELREVRRMLASLMDRLAAAV